jgi:hypothetical protein
MDSEWEQFYLTHSTPPDFEEKKKEIQDFCQHINSERNIVLVTVIKLNARACYSDGNKTVTQEHVTLSSAKSRTEL